MVFTLEALEAEHGDALLLHWGPSDEPRLIVIDGGPGRVWRTALERRLRDLRAALTEGPDDALTADLVVLSHIDDDHVGGLLEMTEGLRRAREEGSPLPWDVLGLWHNAFEDLLDDGTAPAVLATAAGRPATASAGSVASTLPLTGPAAAVVASVDQGRRLRDDAALLQMPVNPGFGGPVRRTEDGRPRPMGAGLELLVLGPSEARLQALRAEWREVVRQRAGSSPAAWSARVAAFVDRSVFNLASIVFLARAAGRTMLLTGDARGDDVLEGLRGAGLLAGGRLHVDLLKLPHHGSDRNVSTEFFRQVTANHYVLSANGRHGNPDPSTLHMLVEARGQAEYTVHLTNRVYDAMRVLENARRRTNLHVRVRRRDMPSLRVDLADDPPRSLRARRIPTPGGEA